MRCVSIILMLREASDQGAVLTLTALTAITGRPLPLSRAGVRGRS